MRARLFELWLRAEPKPVGGSICGLTADDEFGVLHWLLSGQVAGVFAELIDRRREDLERFVLWLLGKARPFAQYLNYDYPFSSFVGYAFGFPHYRVRVRLALEVEKAALHLDLDIPEDVRLPEMPNLDRQDFAGLLPDTPRSKRILRGMQNRVNPGGPGPT
jgi:hypothetical protein